MKRLFFLCFALLTYAPAFSQGDSAIYGISVLTQGSGVYLSTINADDGTVSKISADAIEHVPVGYSRTIDPLHHIFYYASDSGLVALDLRTGELIHKVPLTSHPGSAFRGIQYNYRDSSLYGITTDAAGMNIRLARLDPVTGAVTPVSVTALAAGYNALTGTALDPVRGIFYFGTARNPANHLVGLDLHSGELVSSQPVAIGPGDRFGPMEYSCHDSSLYGLAGHFAHGRKLVRIDPSSGAVSYISLYNIADTLRNEQVTIDPFQKVLYFEAMDHSIRGVSLSSGYLVSLSGIMPLPGSYFTGFIFNHNCFVHSSSSVDEKKIIPELTLFPNPVTDLLTIRSSSPISGIEIFDFTGRAVFGEFCHGQKEIRADLRGLPEGIYVARINTEKGSFSSKFVKTAPGNQSGH